jgi:hypothetical protein
LYLWKISEFDDCPVCAESDTIEHYFYECDRKRSFWTGNTLETRIILSLKDILLGIHNETGNLMLFYIDYCILRGKWYIHRQRLAGKNLFFLEYLQDLKNALNIEKQIFCSQQKEGVFEDKWKQLYEALN